MVVACGPREMEYLKSRDKKLGEAIERIGPLSREGDPDLFASVVHQIVGQQISTAAQATLWRRLGERLGTVDAPALLALGREELQRVGMSFRKADYILDFARRVEEGGFDLEALEGMPDRQVVEALSSLKGVGAWTAEMIMTFSMGRPDVVSYGDLGILRGMRMLYRHRVMDREKFDKYRRRYSPCGTAASLYLWEIARGALPELTDPAPSKRSEDRI